MACVPDIGRGACQQEPLDDALVAEHAVDVRLKESLYFCAFIFILTNFNIDIWFYLFFGDQILQLQFTRLKNT